MIMKEKDVTKHFSELASMGGMVLPSKLSFAISCNMEKLQAEAERIEKARIELCKQYSEKGEAGDPVMVESIVNGKKTTEYKMSDENRELFAKEYMGLLDTEADIAIRTVKMDVIGQCEAVERYDVLTVSHMHALSFMLEE
ncbi:MAG: hypothetical protein Q4E91_06015 [Lachnospiraceae bacterium]|nr:hypothetical protein [Lachnospiraceae bacterium]